MYLLGISEDITERVQNERKLRDAFAGLEKAHAELKSAQSQLILAEKFAAMGKIAGIVSHEFRNQLGVIRNSAYFLKMKLRTEDEKIRNHLDILEKEIQETDRIVENILSFARRNEPAFQPVDLRRVLAASVERASAPPGIRLVTKVRGDLPLIQGDEVLLGRVFVNVILNAIQAMKDSGRLTVQAARAGSFIQVEIEDTGPGIKEEDKERVFDPLFSTKTHGTGLGLATARAIAEAHGGTIELESHFGRGTKVVVRLPAPPEAAAGKPGRA
jgi:signal transduction histidine kinase